MSENLELQRDFDAPPAELWRAWTGATDESGGDVMELRVALAERADGGTRMTLSQGPYDADLLEMAAGGWTSSFGKLDRHLAAG